MPFFHDFPLFAPAGQHDFQQSPLFVGVRVSHKWHNWTLEHFVHFSQQANLCQPLDSVRRYPSAGFAFSSQRAAPPVSYLSLPLSLSLSLSERCIHHTRTHTPKRKKVSYLGAKLPPSASDKKLRHPAGIKSRPAFNRRRMDPLME